MKNIVGAMLVFSTTFIVADELNIVKGTNSKEASKVESLNSQKEFNTGIKIGTLGLGLDVSTPITDKLSARFNLNGASYSDTDTQNGNDYEGTLDLLTAGALVDYYPFENNFRLSGGVYYNGNGFTGNAKPSADRFVEINGVKYNMGDIGSVDSKIEFNKIAPFFGLGWGNDAHDKGWGLTFDLGVMYHGQGEATLTPKRVAIIVDRVKLDSDIQKEEDKINDDLSDFKLYPVLAIGVNYSF